MTAALTLPALTDQTFNKTDGAAMQFYRAGIEIERAMDELEEAMRSKHRDIRQFAETILAQLAPLRAVTRHAEQVIDQARDDYLETICPDEDEELPEFMGVPIPLAPIEQQVTA